MLTIVLPLPHKLLSPNARPCRPVLTRLKRAARADGRIAALVAMQGAGGISPPMWAAATVQCYFFFATNRTRDKDNAAASMKAAMDGISDAGLWVNDSVVTPLPPVFGIDPKNPRVEVLVVEGVHNAISPIDA